MIKAVIFDYDGTLADRCKASSFAFRNYLLEFVVEKDIDKVLLETMVQDLILWDEFGAGVKKDTFARLKKYYGYDVDLTHFLHWWWDNVGKYEPLFPNTLETLKYLKEKGYKLAIITNGTVVGQNNKIDNAGIRDYFDEIIISHAVGLEKPDKEIYEYALNLLNVMADEAVFVGDSYHNDIYGAYKAGLNPIWIWPDDGRVNNDGLTRIYEIGQLREIL